jgi:hypothetical protein
MTVQDLINQLQKFDTSKEVKFYSEIEYGYGNCHYTFDPKMSLQEKDGTLVFSLSGEDEDDE